MNPSSFTPRARRMKSPAQLRRLTESDQNRGPGRKPSLPRLSCFETKDQQMSHVPDSLVPVRYPPFGAPNSQNNLEHP